MEESSEGLFFRKHSHRNIPKLQKQSLEKFLEGSLKKSQRKNPCGVFEKHHCGNFKGRIQREIYGASSGAVRARISGEIPGEIFERISGGSREDVSRFAISGFFEGITGQTLGGIPR